MDVIDHAETGAIEAARGGDADAFGLVVERYQQAAFRSAYLIVRDAAAAEDVTQEAFVRAYRSLASFRPGEPFRPWLLRIVTNLALNDVRARARRSGLLARFGRLSESSAMPPPSHAVESSETSSEVLQAISGLRNDDRVVLLYRYFMEMSEAEIAHALRVPPGTVKSRLHRAGKRLRAVIETRYPHLREELNG